MKGRKVNGMEKRTTYALLIVLILAAFAALAYLSAEPPLGKKSAETKAVSGFCANFTDASGCDSAVRGWEAKTKNGKVYAVVEYQNDGRSAFKEGWIIYIRLSEPLPIPETNRTTFRIGILADKNSNSSQIYEFVE